MFPIGSEGFSSGGPGLGALEEAIVSGSVGSPWSVRRRNCGILEHLEWLCRVEESTMQRAVHEEMSQNAEWWERGDNQGHDIMSLGCRDKRTCPLQACISVLICKMWPREMHLRHREEFGVFLPTSADICPSLCPLDICSKTSQRVSCLGVTSHAVVGRAEGQALRESEGLDYLPSR